MRLRTASLAFVVAVAALSPLGPLEGRARADGTGEQKPKATKASVVALKAKLVKARDAMRALAETPAPDGLTKAQRKVFEAEMKKVADLADGTDGVVKKIDDSIDKAKTDLDSMSEMGEMESLRLQKAMDQLSKMMSTLSNLLKKISDTASSITQNLK